MAVSVCAAPCALLCRFHIHAYYIFRQLFNFISARRDERSKDAHKTKKKNAGPFDLIAVFYLPVENENIVRAALITRAINTQMCGLFFLSLSLLSLYKRKTNNNNIRIGHMLLRIIRIRAYYNIFVFFFIIVLWPSSGKWIDTLHTRRTTDLCSSILFYFIISVQYLRENMFGPCVFGRPPTKRQARARMQCVSFFSSFFFVPFLCRISFVRFLRF